MFLHVCSAKHFTKIVFISCNNHEILPLTLVRKCIQGDFLLFLPLFPGGSDGKESACNAGDQGLIPGLGISPGEENGNALQYSCLENPMDGEAWWATIMESQRVGHD